MSRPIVLMTGCNGFIGQAVARRLAPEYHLIGLDVTPAPPDSPVHELRYTDVTSDLSVDQTLEYVREHHGQRIASVVHLAAYYDFTGEESPLYEKITVQGTGRLLGALRHLHVEQFLFTSTMLVHAPVAPGERIDEDAPLDPRWAYPESKLRTERLIREKRGDIPCALLRLSGVYTDHGKQPTLVQQIKRIHQRELTSFFFPGDSEAGQSLVHIDDAADAIARTVARRAELPPETLLLIGEPDPPAYRALQDAIGEHVWGREWPTVRVPEPLAEAGAWLQERAPKSEPFIKPFMIELADDHYGLDVGRAERLLGWKPRHRVLEVLPTMIAALRRDPVAWYEENGLEVPSDVETASSGSRTNP